MQDIADAVVAAMAPMEPVGYVVQIVGDDYQTPLLEGKGVVLNGKICYMVRSAPHAVHGEPLAPKETWRSQLCTSDDAFRFLVEREYAQLSYSFKEVYVVGPDGNRERIPTNPYGGWGAFESVNSVALRYMVAAMGVLKVPQNGLFAW